MSTLIAEETDAARYEESLRDFPAGPFVTPAWLESFRTSGRLPIYFRFVSDGTAVGGIAGLILEPTCALLRKINRPLFFFSGPVGYRSDPEFLGTCIRALIRHAARGGYTSVEVSSWDYPYAFEANDCGFIAEPRQEYIIDLRRELGDIRRAMRKMIRAKVRKAEEHALTFHESDRPELLEALVSLMERTRAVRREKGYEDYSYYYIRYMDEQVTRRLLESGTARIFYVMERGAILCAQLAASYGRRAYGLLMGSTDRGYELGANAFLWWRVIERFRRQGCAILNLGGVANDGGSSGLSFFKTSLGAEPHICTGGYTKYLQGAPAKLIYRVCYGKFSFETVRKILRLRALSRRNRTDAIR